MRHKQIAKGMEDLRLQYNPTQRKEFQDTLSDMRQYLVPLLLRIQGGVCKQCELPAEHWDIHETLYNPKITLKELWLLCIPCHKQLTNFTRIDYRA